MSVLDYRDVLAVGFFAAVYVAACVAQLLTVRACFAECEACRAAEARRVGP